MTDKHTPTPWGVAYETTDGSGWVDIKGYNETYDSNTVLGYSCSRDVEQNIANAKRIVKCVNMHDELVEALEDIIRSEDLTPAHEDHIKGIIKKARGEL